MCHIEHALYALHEWGAWEEGRELGCSVVGWLYTLLACTYTVFVCVTPCMCGCSRILFHFPTGLHSCMCMSNTCCNSLSLSSYHLPALPLDPLVNSLVACQILTSLDLRHVTLSLQCLLAVVKGLHNLRALGLKWMYLSDKRVSD